MNKSSIEAFITWCRVQTNASELLGEIDRLDHLTAVWCACAVAETALGHIPAHEDRPRLAIETARNWVRGIATKEHVDAASARAYIFAWASISVTASAVYAARAAGVAFLIKDSVTSRIKGSKVDVVTYVSFVNGPEVTQKLCGTIADALGDLPTSRRGWLGAPELEIHHDI